MSPAQQRACDELLPRFGVAFGPAPLDFARVFGRTAPVVLEIGFGMGETTAAIAQAHPDVDFLGVEVHLPGVGALLKRIDELGLLQRARHPARRGRSRRRDDRAGLARRACTSTSRTRGRRSATTSGGCCQPAFVRALARAHRARRLPARRDRLDALRRGDPRDARRGAAASRTPRPATRRARRGGRRPSSSCAARKLGHARVRPGVHARPA